MFFRVKRAGSYQYLQIVHSMREGQKVRQQVFATLGRIDELKASGRLDALMRSGLRHCENLAVIDAHAAGRTEPVTVLRIGPELVFGRLWKESGIQEVVQSLLQARRYEFELNGQSISRCCIDSLPVAAIELLNAGEKTISFREPKHLISITSTERWRSWARRLNQRAKRPWVHHAA
jgi:hypothetical protein